MGANNSNPKSAVIHNPNMKYATVEITPLVVQRLEKQINDFNSAGTPPKQACSCQMKEHSIAKRPTEFELLQVRAFELEETQFKQTSERLEKLLGTPTSWMDDIKDEINNMRMSVLQCYSQSGGQPLQCSKEVREFQNFVNKQQFLAILKHPKKYGRLQQQTS